MNYCMVVSYVLNKEARKLACLQREFSFALEK